MSDRGAPGNDVGEMPSWVDRVILPFVTEPTLWPILLVAIGHAVAFVTPALLWAVRDGRPAAQAALLGLAFLTLRTLRFDFRRRRRPGALSGIVFSMWILSGVLAVAADRYGVL